MAWSMLFWETGVDEPLTNQHAPPYSSAFKSMTWYSLPWPTLLKNIGMHCDLCTLIELSKIFPNEIAALETDWLEQHAGLALIDIDTVIEAHLWLPWKFSFVLPHVLNVDQHRQFMRRLAQVNAGTCHVSKQNQLTQIYDVN
jgi:hypothetical protein